VIDAVIRDLSYIGYLVEAKSPQGPYFEAAVIHHTDCGSRLLEDPELRHGFAQRSGYDEQQLATLPATVSAETVRGDVAKILAAPQVSTRITVSGHVYDTASGLLETVAEPVGIQLVSLSRASGSGTEGEAGLRPGTKLAVVALQTGAPLSPAVWRRPPPRC
jgi:hypothetical protein